MRATEGSCALFIDKGPCSPAATDLASQAVVSETAKSGRKFPLRARRVDRDVQDVEGRLGFVAFKLDRVVGVSDDDVIDLLEQRRRSGPPVIAELSRAQLVEVRREDGCGVALNRELAGSNAEADRAHAFDPTPRA